MAPSASLFSRLFTALDGILLAYAEMIIRNGNVQRYDV
jgi:hypothetical protein